MSLEPGDDYTCTLCKGTFRTDWSEEESLQEFRRDFPVAASHLDAIETICGDCHEEFIRWWADKSQ